MSTLDAVLKPRLSSGELSLWRARARERGLSLSALVREAMNEPPPGPRGVLEVEASAGAAETFHSMGERSSPSASPPSSPAEQILPKPYTAMLHVRVNELPRVPVNELPRVPVNELPRVDPRTCPNRGFHRLCSPASPCKTCGATGRAKANLRT